MANEKRHVLAFAMKLTLRLKGFATAHPQFRLAKNDLEVHALSLYKQMNESFAQYDPFQDKKNNHRGANPKAIAKIKTICGQSFANTLIDAMEQLDPRKQMRWTWTKSLSDPKLVSFWFQPTLPGQPESDLIQAVIRIHGQEVQGYDVNRFLTIGIG
jgi:MBA1-like protein